MMIHTVQPGDTLASIAYRYDTSVQRLIELNNIFDSDYLWIGQILQLDEADDMALYATDNTQNEGTPNASPRANPINNINAGSSSSTIISGLRYTITTNRSRYQRGDRVSLTLTKCNVSRNTITLRYDTSQRFNFIALSNGREIWRWSDGQSFNRRGGTEELRPGDCRTYRAVWDLRNRQGNFVSNGNFTIRAFNLARTLSNRFVQTTIRVGQANNSGGGSQPPSLDSCPQSNMLSDPSMERWLDRSTPRIWSGSNTSRSSSSHSGNYAARLGANTGRSSVLAQTISVNPNRIYRVSFWAMEEVQPRRNSNFELAVEIYIYDNSGTQIGRVDPLYSPSRLPNNSYQQFSFTTGVFPSRANRAEIRFVFRPRSGNENAVVIDDVAMICVR